MRFSALVLALVCCHGVLAEEPIVTSGPETDPSPVTANWLGDRLTFSGVIAAGLQAEFTGRAEERGAITFRPSFDLAISPATHAHVTLALSGGDALNGVTRFNSGPWGADLESDVEDINGSDVDYLQTAWVSHGFEVGTGTLTVTGGWIDATEYVDQNELANDEFVDFKSTLFLNAETAFIPSYALGGVIEYEADGWTLTGLAKTVDRNDDGNRYEYIAAQMARAVETPLGAGNYRLMIAYGTDDFAGPDGTGTESRYSVGVSADQALSETISAWGRLGWTDRAAAVDYETIAQAGLQVDGALWHRAGDAIGVGYAWLNGGNTGIQSTHAIEAYLRMQLIESLSLSLDAQYIYDNRTDGADADGVVLGAFLVFTY